MNMRSEAREHLRTKNRRTLWVLAGVVILMFGFGFALVPLYGLLCDLTGTPSIAKRASDGRAEGAGAAPVGAVASDRTVTIKFDATVHPDLPWSIRPLDRSLRVTPGETYEVRFLAENRSSESTVGQAIPSVAPWQVTDYLSKLECFCFNKQTLAGGESREMPLRFIISPAIPEGIDSLTLSYSVLRLEDEESDANRLAAR